MSDTSDAGLNQGVDLKEGITSKKKKEHPVNPYLSRRKTDLKRNRIKGNEKSDSNESSRKKQMINVCESESVCENKSRLKNKGAKSIKGNTGKKGNKGKGKTDNGLEYMDVGYNDVDNSDSRDLSSLNALEEADENEDNGSKQKATSKQVSDEAEQLSEVDLPATGISINAKNSNVMIEIKTETSDNDKIVPDLKTGLLKKKDNSCEKALVFGIKCLKCNMSFSNRKEFVSHIRECHKSVMLCELCDICFASVEALNKHMDKSHDVKTDTAGKSDHLYTSPSEESSEELTESELKKHKSSVHSACSDQSNFECQLCGQCFEYFDKLTEHVISEHTEEDDEKKEVFTCDVCTKIVVGRAYYEQHKMMHVFSKNRKIHKCLYEGCMKEFSDTSNLKKHVNSVHLNIRNYLCEFCVSSFKTLSSLKVHISCYHTKNRPMFSCSVCNKSFLRKISLERHESLHISTERTYICSFEGCGKSFRVKENLTKHEKYVHKGVKPYQCSVCQERFSRKTYLETHMYKHTGIKAFNCEVCGKFFSQRGNLRTHMLLHSKERPIYECPQCSQTFNFKSNLTKHQQKHMENEDYGYKSARTYTTTAGKMDDHFDLAEYMKMPSHLSHDSMVAKATTTTYDRKKIECKEQNKSSNSEFTKVLMTSPALSTLEKRGKKKSVVLVVKQLKNLQAIKTLGKQVEGTDVAPLENNKVKGGSNSISDLPALPTQQNTVPVYTVEKINNMTTIKEKTNVSKCEEQVLIFSYKAGSSTEAYSLNLEKAVENVCETSKKENSEIGLKSTSLICPGAGDTNTSEIKNSNTHVSGTTDKNSADVSSVFVGDMTETDTQNTTEKIVESKTVQNNSSENNLTMSKSGNLNSEESFLTDCSFVNAILKLPEDKSEPGDSFKGSTVLGSEDYAKEGEVSDAYM